MVKSKGISFFRPKRLKNHTLFGALVPHDGVYVVFVDFHRSFDLVDCGILLTKLLEMGVSKGNKAFSSNPSWVRTQEITFPGHSSNMGLPKAGVISPTLFYAYFNDPGVVFPETHLSYRCTCMFVIG